MGISVRLTPNVELGRLLLNIFPVTAASRSRVDRALKSTYVGQVSAANSEMALLLNKHYQALLVRGRLKGMSVEATDMPAKLRAELRNATDRHITSVTLLDGRRLTSKSYVRNFKITIRKNILQGLSLSLFHLNV